RAAAVGLVAAIPSSSRHKLSVGFGTGRALNGADTRYVSMGKAKYRCNIFGLIVVFLCGVLVCPNAHGQVSLDTEWPTYGNDPGGNAILAAFSDQPRECVKAESCMD